MMKFAQFLNEKITNDNKEPVDHLARYLSDRKCSDIKKVPSGVYCEYKSPRAYGISCKFYSYKYFTWLDFDDADNKLLYHVIDISKIKKGEILEPDQSFITANDVAEYIASNK